MPISYKILMTHNTTYKKFFAVLTWVAKNNFYKNTAELSEKAGISQGYLSKILNAKVSPGHDIQEKIAKGCGYELLDFLELKTTTPPTSKDALPMNKEVEYLKTIIALKDKIADLERRLAAKPLGEANFNPNHETG